MASYNIELSDEVKSFRRSHCGEGSMTMWGWASRDNAAYVAYCANLMTGRQEISARLRAIRNCAGHALRRRKKEDKIDHAVGLECHKRIGHPGNKKNRWPQFITIATPNGSKIAA